MPTKFKISIKIGYKTKRIDVEYIPVNHRVERFKLYGNNIIILESNRPFLRKKGLKHWAPTYKLIEGHVQFNATLDPFIDQINQYLENNTPVKFEHQGKIVNGILCRVTGAGKNNGMYHLEVDNRHWGELFKTHDGWRWASNTEQELEKFVDHFISSLQ